MDAISGDEKGNLWVGAGGRVVQLKDGRFQPALEANGAPLPKQFQGMSAGMFWSRVEDRFYAFNRGKLTSFTIGKELSERLLPFLYPDQRGNLWLATKGGELVKVREGKVVKRDEQGRVVWDAAGGFQGTPAGRWLTGSQDAEGAATKSLTAHARNAS